MTSRHSRQSFLGPGSDELLAKTKVGIVGLCGGGSHVAQQLAHIGIGRFVVSDFDLPDETNQNRMVGLMHRHLHSGEEPPPKCSVIKELIHGINPKADVCVVESKWEMEPSRFKDCKVLFGCVDSYLARNDLERIARRYLIPFIDVGMDVHGDDQNFFITGQVILSIPGFACMRCMGFLTEERLAAEARDYGLAGSRPQVIWPNGVLASTAVGKFMAMLTTWGPPRSPSLYTQYDGNRDILSDDSRIEALSLEHRLCPHFPIGASLGDLFKPGLNES